MKMAKVYVETEDMSKEEVVELLVDKDKKIEELEHFKFLILKAYENHKVSDTYKIDSEKVKKYVEMMEDLMLIENKRMRA